jgi:hypothetical protein
MFVPLGVCYAHQGWTEAQQGGASPGMPAKKTAAKKPAAKKAAAKPAAKKGKKK